MIWNDKTPEIKVDPETYEVRVNGEIATVDPAKESKSCTKIFHGITNSIFKIEKYCYIFFIYLILLIDFIF